MFESLFDDIQRNYEGAAGYSEPNFSYINRSAREYYSNARKTLDLWFKEYSRRHSSEAISLRNNFRSISDKDHFSALTELYVHNLLVTNGFDTEVHPEINTSTHHPDFLAKQNGQPKFYIEAMAIHGNLLDKKAKHYESKIIDVLNKIPVSNFFISVEFVNSDPETDPPLSKIKKDVEEGLSRLDYDQVLSTKEATDLPSWEGIYNKWHLNFTVLPIPKEDRSRFDNEPRLVGTIDHPFKMVGSDITLKERLSEKAKKYGRLNIPFVIAANISRDQFFRDDDLVMDALFGKETVTITNYSDGSHSTKFGRNKKGVFISPNKIRYTRLSGVLILPGLKAATLEIIKPTMWLHPKAINPLEAGYIKVRHKIYNPTTDKMDEINF